jgi:formylglycine-generating enzyme required for sulfatase activity
MAKLAFTAALSMALALVASAHAQPVTREDGTSRALPGRGQEFAQVGPGTYRPLYPPSPQEMAIEVHAFRLDKLPVTNGDFLAFVRAHPEWARDRVARIFADSDYLSHWAAPSELGANVDALQPVVRVSWFAAKAYCAARGARLPTESEWELAASASRTSTDGRNDAAWREQILTWYARPNPKRLPRVGTTPANYWGVQDLHGLVWEWVLDFNSAMVNTDARKSGDKDRLTFCGGGAITATEKGDYPSFMRIAFRSSLRADYTTHTLGFRCAADEPRDGGP